MSFVEDVIAWGGPDRVVKFSCDADFITSAKWRLLCDGGKSHKTIEQ